MPTDSELIVSFNNLSADAQETLKKLREFTENTSGTIVWNLSNGVAIETEPLAKIIQDAKRRAIIYS